MFETTKLGAAFSDPPDERRVVDLAMDGMSNVFYKEVNAEKNKVVPCFAASALRGTPPEGLTAAAISIVNLWPQLYDQITSENSVKTWESGLILLEAVCAALIGEGRGQWPVFADEVLRGAVVKHWSGQEMKRLQYRKDGCVSCDTLLHRQGEASCASWEKDNENLRDACKQATATIRMADSVNYPSIEGVHTLLEDSESKHVVPVVFQMKMRKKVSETHIAEWADAAHKRAQQELNLKAGEYFVALYLKSGDVGLSQVEGTIYVDGTTVRRLLEPFGMTPLLQLLEDADNSTR